MRTAGLKASLGQSGGAAVLLVALVCAVFAYAPGLTGGLHFDDPANLGGLAQVSDLSSAIRFVAGGDAGPSGRPIALASFALQAYAWPSALDVLLRTNILLHLLNGVLVTWLLYLFSLARGCQTREAGWAGSIAGALWMLSPLLASASLMIVQRMTTLSATFLLLGFIAYLYSRRWIERRPRRALIFMSLSVGLGTVLAFFSKENGGLLPLLILITEITLLPHPSEKRAALCWRTWCAGFLLVPTIAIFVYLALRLPYPPSVDLHRGFTGSERLLTEARILWQYVYHAFLPATSALGPFHDDQPLYTQWLQPLSALAVLGWIAVCAAAVILRKRAPLFAFAVAWYLVGHALESTTIPLELYFEHRNYVPLIGPFYALVAAVISVAPGWQVAARGALAAYGTLFAIVLFNTTSLWGNPAVAGKIWSQEHPNSARATLYLARQFEIAGDQNTAKNVLSSYLDGHPDNSSIALQKLTLACLLEPKKTHRELIEQVSADLEKPKFYKATFSALQALYGIAKEHSCSGVDREMVYGLTGAAAANPAYRAVPQVLHNLHVLMSEEAFARRDLNLTMHHLDAALSAHYAMTTLETAVTMLDSAGLYSDARDFVRRGREHVPWRPLRARIWNQHLANLEKAIDKASRAAQKHT